MSGYLSLLNQLERWPVGTEVAVFFTDINDFRSINRLGSPLLADQVLSALADRLQEWSGTDGVAAHLWSDEFVVVRAIDHPQQTGELALELRSCVAGCEVLSNILHRPLSVSIGVVCGRSGRNWEELLHQSQLACDQARARGFNQIAVYSPQHSDRAQLRTQHQLVAEFRDHLAQQRLCLFAQPIMDIREREPRVAKAEFLLRIRHQDRWIPPPPGMIQALEAFGASAELDLFSVELLLDWLDTQRPALERLDGVSVNLSAQSFIDDLLMSRLYDALRQARLPAGKFCFEITETAAISHLQVAAEIIADFKAAGARFSLDDFGSGLCSFGYLQALMIDEVKVDGSFIRGIADNPVNEQIICAIHRIARATGKSTVAEFVDDVRKLQAIRRIGFDYAQGWLFHPALPLEEFLALL